MERTEFARGCCRCARRARQLFSRARQAARDKAGLRRFKERIRELTTRSRGRNIQFRLRVLQKDVPGWLNALEPSRGFGGKGGPTCGSCGWTFMIPNQWKDWRNRRMRTRMDRGGRAGS